MSGLEFVLIWTCFMVGPFLTSFEVLERHIWVRVEHGKENIP